jgi:hypothetical protein
MRPTRDERSAKEEAFSTLLQRIQRQYRATAVSGGSRTTSSSSSSSAFLRRPPDEAAYALGKGLGVSFLSLASSEERNNNDNNNDTVVFTTKVIPKSIQEKTLTALADRTMNPSVVHGFFHTLLQDTSQEINNTTKGTTKTTTRSIINMEVWIPTWILYTEQKGLTTTHDHENNKNYSYHDDDDDDGWLGRMSFEALTCMIRAYAQFIRIKSSLECSTNNDSNLTTTATSMTVTSEQAIKGDFLRGGNSQQQQQQQQHPHDPRSLAHPSSYIGTVAKTYTKLQTQAARLAMLREFTTAAFSNQVENGGPSSDVVKLMLTPLIACSVLATSTSSSSSSSSTDHIHNTHASMAEATLCMEGIWRESYAVVYEEVDDTALRGENFDGNGTQKSSEDIEQVIRSSAPSSRFIYIVEIIRWLSEIFDMFLLSIPCRQPNTKVPCKELAHRWLAMILDLGCNIVQPMSKSVIGDEEPTGESHFGDNTWQLLEDWFENIVSGLLLRWFAILPSYRMSMEIIWPPLHALNDIFTVRRPFRLVTVFKLSTIALSHPIMEDVREILQLLARSIEYAVDVKTQDFPHQKLHPMHLTIVRGLCSIFLRNSICARTTENILHLLSQTKRLKPNSIVKSTVRSGFGEKDHLPAGSRASTGVLQNVIELLEEEPSTAESLIRFVSYEGNDLDDTDPFSPIQQAGLLVLGLGLLDSKRHQRFAYSFLKKVVAVYPHLGVSLLPVMVDSINACAIRGDGEFMMEQIRFLCTELVRDSQCAHEVWNLLGVELMRDTIPSIIRSSIIRVFPQICHSNKRLYKRVIESMGNSLSVSTGEANNGNLEVQLAVAATTADLAREDCIRDPTDVIGWIQGFIGDAGWIRPVSTLDRENTPGKAALNYYAIRCLHHLVAAQELDYKLVLVVLSKRLCNVHNIEEVSKLPPLVLESLILLLGDGELDDEDSEEDDKHKVVGVSPQVSRSVETLIKMWHIETLRLSHETDPILRTTMVKSRGNIFYSLSKYSFEALGVDEEGVQEAVNAVSTILDEKTQSLSPTADRYKRLEVMISDAISTLKTTKIKRESNKMSSGEDIDEDDEFHSFSAFISKILKFEEDCLGSTLWQKRSGIRRKGPKKQYGKGLQFSLKPGNSELLPTSEACLRSYSENRCQSTGKLNYFECRYNFFC